MGYFGRIVPTREWLWPFFCVTCAYQTYIARLQIEDTQKTLSALKELQDALEKKQMSQAASSTEGTISPNMLLSQCMQNCIISKSTELTVGEETCLRNCADKIKKVRKLLDDVQ